MHARERHLRAAVDPLDTSHSEGPAGMRAAGVLLLFDRREPDLPLLFVQRTAHLRHHAGQIAFPGGVAEPADSSIVATALREAREEAGIPADAVEVIGLLPPFLTATSDRWLTPVVALQHRDIALVPDPFEVARLFHISLRELATCPHDVRDFERDGRSRPVHFYRALGNLVWGVTAAIIDELLVRMQGVDAADALSGSADAPRMG